MARVSKSTSMKNSFWKPTPRQIGVGAAGLAGLGTLGYLASKYPSQTTKLAQKGLSGLISGLPILGAKISTGENIGKFIGEKALSSFLPFGVVIN